ncbi:c-type cytochrome [Cycloclasticus zancles]|jgi:cytochrome c5|uniref:Cytochrome c, class I n=1 Tax=Cycloclasticus zancles 78-ME TaxID=1198232 RepID=S5TFL9_9GAMM|nr:cytochrome c [Cycloclasticus zancles]AGS39642.1 Cytochrome c, class I [Cycloclasticus zancles 78-ME]
MIILNKKYTHKVGFMACLILFFGLLSPVVFASEEESDPKAGDFSRGSKAWSENCMRCHSMRSPTELRDDQWKTTVFHMRVRAGLTGQETRDILAFLQASNAPISSANTTTVKPTIKKVASSSAISGEKIYQSNCMACHGANGKGALPGVPDFTNKMGPLTKTDAQLLNNIINGFQSPNSSMQMPARGGNSSLSDAELSAALGYIRETFSN